MATDLQFATIATAFLTWCLVSALWSIFAPERANVESRLIRREHCSDGWTGWREVHFGLARADRRFLQHPEPDVDTAGYATVLNSVLRQPRVPESIAVQFAIVHTARHFGADRNVVVFVSAVHEAVVAANRI